MERRRLLAEGRGTWSKGFSQGWQVGDFVFVSGQVPVDEHGQLIGRGNIRCQTRTVFEMLTEVLEDAGAAWADVIKLNTYYVFAGPDAGAQAFWQEIVAVRSEFLPDPPPAATAARVVGLAIPDALVEVEAIAIIAR